MHKLKHVHDTFKVLQFSFHTNQCNILLPISLSKFYIHAYHNAPVKQILISQQILNHIIFKVKKTFQNHAQEKPLTC